jgi:inhibitor of cysteine peptidase
MSNPGQVLGGLMYASAQLLAVVEILALVLFLAGCTQASGPIADPSGVLTTEEGPTPSETSRLTATSETDMTESAPHVTPYIQVKVLDVEVRFLETSPVQVDLVIRGTLPDQCEYGFYAVETRAAQTVRVSLAGIHPSDTDCAQTEQTIEYVLPLGRDMPEAARGFSPGDYKLTVNNYQTSFSIK